MSMLWELLPLFGMFFAGLGFWALGKWLRSKGHGEALDRAGVRFVRFRRASYGLLGPLGGAMLGLGRGLSRFPVFGSKRARAAWDLIEHNTEQKHDK